MTPVFTSEGWKSDAAAPHGWSFKEYRERLIHETPQIQEFLASASTRKFIISAPKGFGKTLLLIAKSLQIRQQSDYRVVSAEEVLDRPPGRIKELSKEKLLEFRADYDRWNRIWSVCIMIAAIKLDRHAAKTNPVDDEAECDAWTARMLQNRTEYAAASIFTILVDLDYKTRESALLSENYLARCFSNIHAQTALFIDNADQFFDPLLEDQSLIHKDDLKQASSRHKSNHIWKIGQLGLVGAAYQLHNLNSHVKVFCTIRREALSSLRDCDSNHNQILGRTIEIEYKREDLRDIFVKNIKLTDKLFPPATSDPVEGPMSQFFGPSYGQMMHTILDQTEPAFDFVLRHTFYRPRDLMMIGEEIAMVHPAERTQAKLKEVVREISADIVDGLKSEMMSFFPLPRFHKLLPHITHNIMTRDQLEEVEEKYVGSLKEGGFQPSNDAVINHPFRAMYEVGMLGIIRTDYPNGAVPRQVFVKPREVVIRRPEGLPPTKGWYLIHSALDNMIHNAAGESYFQHFDNTNIIGNGNPWKEPITSLFVLRGDICKFSKIMESEFYRTAIDKMYEWVLDSCHELNYYEVSGGDSLLLIDKNPFRLVEAMNSIMRKAEQDSELSLQFRFGGAAGPVTFKSFRVGEDGHRNTRRIPTGLALRTSSRLEPHAQVGALIVDEHFKRLDSSSKLYYTELMQQDMTSLSYKTDTQKFNVQKNESDPAHETKLFRVSTEAEGSEMREDFV